jgi:Carboxypeptidase regulatory-like domain
MKKAVTPLLILSLLMMTWLMPAVAQITTSTVFGTILDEKKQVQVGATVIFSLPSTGLKYAAMTDEKGGYVINNLNPGGPYEVEVKFLGYQPVTQKEIYLPLGSNQRFDYNMTTGTTEMQSVEVVANKKNKITGAEFNTLRLESVPTLTRNVTDVTKLTPQSNNNSFAGTSFRYNNVTLDGAINNDAIGFSPSLGGISGTSNMPGSSTRTSSFSMDAIQEVQAQIAPFDVRLGNFTGGSINAVSRRGTNDFHGSAYIYGQAGAITGPNSAGDGRATPSSFYDVQAGFRLGMPIIKNKVFWFTNEEITRHQDPVFFAAGDTGNFMTTAIAQRITDSLSSATFMPKNKYNPSGVYNPGTYGKYNIQSNSIKFFNRFDFAINDNNQLSIRNNTILSDATNLERNSQEFQFGNYDFKQKSLNTSTVIELKTRINDHISNNAIVGYTYIHDYRDPVGDIAPNIQINGFNGGGRALLGTNREAGIFNTKQNTIEITDNLTYYKGKHKFTFGTHNEIYKIDFGFINSWNGRIDYANVNDFYANKPSRMRAIYNLGDNSRVYNFDNPSASFWIAMLSVYAQDDIAISKRLNLSVGLRIDAPIMPSSPTRSSKQDSFPNPPAHYGASYTTVNNVSKLDNKILGGVSLYNFSPRIGFNYDVRGNQKVVIRGGTGLFSGRVPFAWFGYAYYNNGSTFGAFDYKNAPAGTHIPTDPSTFKNYNDSVLKQTSRVELDIFDKNFKMPQVWRSSLAVDFKVPGDVKFTIEGTYTKVISDILIQQVNLFDSVKYNPSDIGLQQAVYLGGRNSNSYSNVYYITNTDKGYRYTITGMVQKSFKFGLDMMAAYTYGGSKDMFNGIRNSPESGWQLNQSLSANSPVLSISNFDIRHRIVATVTFRRDWDKKKHFTTTAALIYTASSGTPFTWGVTNNNKLSNSGQQLDLVYIPKTQADIAFTKNAGNADSSTTQQWNALDAFITSQPYLNAHRGQFTQRNGDNTPWNHNLDLRIMQDFNFYAGADKKHKHTLQITWDVINLTNLLNSAWGWYYYTPNTLNSTVNIGLTPTGKYDPVSKQPTYTFTNPASTANYQPYSVDQLASRWRMQFGVRYIF